MSFFRMLPEPYQVVKERVPDLRSEDTHRNPALFPPYIVIASKDKLRGRQNPMKKLTLVVDERELSTIRAALFLLQEQVDALPEDLAEMVARDGRPMTGA